MNDAIDLWLIKYIGMTHPPLWMMWFAILMAWVFLCNRIGGKHE
jgi:hypothetical protein